VRNVGILVISATKISKQRLHAASASRGQSPPDLLQGPIGPWTPLGNFCPLDLLDYSRHPQMKISGAAIGYSVLTHVDCII